MVEFDDDGIQWAEAAVPPSDSDLSMDATGETEHATDGTQSPFSTVHLGAPPPPPPTTTPIQPAGGPAPIQITTPRRGALTPPTTMRQVTTSPIEITPENFDE